MIKSLDIEGTLVESIKALCYSPVTKLACLIGNDEEHLVCLDH